MSLETPASSEAVTETTSASETPAAGSGYSATDPGFDAGLDSGEDELASLIAENTKSKPSETLDDASDAKSETEETVETPADDAADSDGISDELLDRAFELGYTVDDLKSFSDSKSMEREISRVEKIQKRLAERQGTKPKEDAPVEETDPEPNWDELVELGHDPDIVALNKKTWQRAQAAESQARQIIQAEQNRAFEAQCNRFDEALNKMEGFESILGSGRRGDLAKASPEHVANRQKVFTKMQMLAAGYEQAGMPVPPEADLIQEAVQASFYKHAQEIARKSLTKQIKKAGSQALSRPRSAGGKPLSGQQLAIAKEQEFWNKHRE